MPGDNGPRSFFTELKRRNVYKVAVAYTVVGWLLIQVATQVFPFFEIPNWGIRLIVLVIALGLPIALIIAWAFELTPDGIRRTDAVDPAPTRHRSGRVWIYVVVVGVLLSLGLFLAGRYSAPDHTASTGDKSIAVLPFENRSEDKANAYFADGIQDEILSRLAKIDGLKVISRTSVQRYKSSPENIPEIARQLRVAHILEGSVQKAGEQVRVNVQLIRADTDGHVWAEVYDRKLTDIFGVQSDIAAKVAKALRLKLSGREEEAVASRPTESPEAYDAYLRGLVLWNRFTQTLEDVDQTVRYFARAVELDPNFALGWAYLALVQSFKYTAFDSTPERAAEAKRALDRAQELQPDLGEFWLAQGMYRYKVLRDFDRALESFEKARERLANRVTAIEFSAYVKRRQGHWEEALQLHAQSIELDPRNPIILSEAAVTNGALRRFDKAHPLLERALLIEPGNSELLAQKALLHLVQGDFAAAGDLLGQVRFNPRDSMVVMVLVRDRLWQRQFAEGIAILQRALAEAGQLAPVVAANYRAELAVAQALAGEPGAAALSAAQQELMSLRARHGPNPWTTTLLIELAGFLQEKEKLEALVADSAEDIRRDALQGAAIQTEIASARAHLGEKAAALEGVAQQLRTPAEMPLTPAALRHDPMWDPLRNEPQFQKLLESQP